MKKIINCFLSCILLIQTTAYSQVIYPTGRNVEETYNKVYALVNSSAALKDFSSDNQITPILAMSSFAAAIKFNTPEELAYLLKKFDIDADPHASITELYDKAYEALKKMRLSYSSELEELSKEQLKYYRIIDRVKQVEPNVFEYYRKSQKDLLTKEELVKLGKNDFSTSIKYNNVLFQRACRNARFAPEVVADAYNYFLQLKKQSVLEIQSKDKLLITFAHELGYYEGDFEASSEMKDKMVRYVEKGPLGQIDENKINHEIDALVREAEEIGNKYNQEYSDLKSLYKEQKEQLKELKTRFTQGDKGVTISQIKRLESKVDDLGIECSKAAGKLEAYNKWPLVTKFTENGGLFVATIALFSLADHLIKVNDIKTSMASKNKAGFALLDTIDDNRNNLYALLEQLPDNMKDVAFNHIAENYFDDFQNQTKNVLYALAILEKPSLLNYTPENNQQKVSDKFDKLYQNAERELEQSVLNIYPKDL